MISLDFSKETAEERLKVLTIPDSPTLKELETCADYLLYGKDSKGETPFSKKEIIPNTKYKTFSKKNMASLEALYETEGFKESSLSPIGRTHTNPKPILQKDLPELQPLLETISVWQQIYDEAISLQNTPNPPKTKTQIYKLKHFLIELKTQQYLIQEVVLGRKANTASSFYAPVHHNNIGSDVRPLGLKVGNSSTFSDIGPKSIPIPIPQLEGTGSFNFENPKHIYELINFYSILLERSELEPEAPSKYLIETLDYYIDLAALEESRLEILKLKIHKYSNIEIVGVISRKFGKTYNDNYISTILTKEISKKIAEAATLHKDRYLQQNDHSRWKKCGVCGEWKLKDKREFNAQKSSTDGYMNRCKVCGKNKKKNK